jgi:uncharacterized protein with HEPN domain
MANNGNTNEQILRHIIGYAEQIEEANAMFNASEEELKNNSVYRNAAALCILQIGELSNRLTEDYRVMTEAQIPWRAIRGLRNIVAHHYGKIDYKSLWETINQDIPALREFCENQVLMFETMKEEALEYEESEEDMGMKF